MKAPPRYFVVHAPAGFEGYPKRRTRYFKTKNAAREFRVQIRRWKENQKNPPLNLEFTERDQRWIAYLQAHIGSLDLLPEIISHWQKTAKGVRNPLLVADLCAQYVAYRQTKALKPSTLADDKWVCHAFASYLVSLQCHDVTTRHIRDFLDTATSDSTARKFYKIISQLFEFGRERLVVVINPCTEVKRPIARYSEPRTLKPEMFKILLDHAKTEYPALLPFLAFAGFAGVRREELLREYRFDQVLQWENIHWGRGLIEIRSEVAKKTSRRRGDRRFIPIEPALAYWLECCRKATGNVVALSDSAFRRQYKALCQRVAHIPQRNELRHSFASFWLARSTESGLGALAKIMGNSEAVTKKHYVEVLSPEDGTEWFGVR